MVSAVTVSDPVTLRVNDDPWMSTLSTVALTVLLSVFWEIETPTEAPAIPIAMAPEPTSESNVPICCAVICTAPAAMIWLFDDGPVPSMVASTSLVTVFDEFAPAPEKAAPRAIVPDVEAARLWASPIDMLIDITVTPPADVIVEPKEYALSVSPNEFEAIPTPIESVPPPTGLNASARAAPAAFAVAEELSDTSNETSPLVKVVIDALFA